ncbi:PPOX class probable F420-dependent enzyme [Microterricola gilva]|uniref:PPOX class probable F420-dependent enzyme n=1 Tax=Microterricola gilva TaxID=393267 RepID=A0A4Q8ANB1_9MICO|nr:pyridoxamine 5'-phosphate oxidase family protein [Microterricola gilva]RZU66018.1 PPOX class probable F420-dependent enzyme [Microterricola gilva]
MTASSEPAAIRLDPADEVQGRAIARLERERIGWLTSMRANGFPHAVPIWFLWHDDELIVLSEPGAVKVRNIRGNPKVLLHLEAGANGDELTVLQGIAEISPDPTAAWVDRIGAAYGAKYTTGLADLNMTMRSMAAQYSAVIRITPTKLIAW